MGRGTTVSCEFGSYAGEVRAKFSSGSENKQYSRSVGGPHERRDNVSRESSLCGSSRRAQETKALFRAPNRSKRESVRWPWRRTMRPLPSTGFPECGNQKDRTPVNPCRGSIQGPGADAQKPDVTPLSRSPCARSTAPAWRGPRLRLWLNL